MIAAIFWARQGGAGRTVAALYQQGRVHHIGTFPQLEDEMTNSYLGYRAINRQPTRTTWVIGSMEWKLSRRNRAEPLPLASQAGSRGPRQQSSR